MSCRVCDGGTSLSELAEHSDLRMAKGEMPERTCTVFQSPLHSGTLRVS